MDDNCICPYCGYEEAYHNGVCFECPDCDATWGEVFDEETVGE